MCDLVSQKGWIQILQNLPNQGIIRAIHNQIMELMGIKTRMSQNNSNSKHSNWINSKCSNDSNKINQENTQDNQKD